MFYKLVIRLLKNCIPTINVLIYNGSRDLEAKLLHKPIQQTVQMFKIVPAAGSINDFTVHINIISITYLGLIVDSYVSLIGNFLFIYV